MQLGLTVLTGVAVRTVLGLNARGRDGAATLRKLLNKIVLWVTMPALIFQAVHAAPLGKDMVQVPATAILGMACTALVSWLLLARLYGRTAETGGLVLAASAGSVSFFGIPIVRALFGPEQARVAVYFAVLNVPLALLSAAIISTRVTAKDGSAGARGGSLLRVAATGLKQFVTLPATWALIAALLLRTVPLPHFADQTIKALSTSVAPTTMFALGLGLTFERSFAPYRMALPAVAIKLAISPIVVLLCGKLLGLTGLPLVIVALQGAMPTQVLGVVVAEKYRLDSRLVGLTLAIDTALAFLLLPVVLSAIRATTAAQV